METTDNLDDGASAFLIDETPETPEVEDEDDEVTQDDAPETDETEDDVETAEDAEAGDDEASDDVDEDDDDPDEPETIRVKVDGEEVEVTLEDLKRSYSGNAKIQKGMQEAATLRKQAEAAYQTLAEQQSKFAQFAQHVQQNGFIKPPQPPSPELASSDPAKYVRDLAQFNAQQQAFQQQQQTIQQTQRQMQAAQQAAMEAHLNEQLQALQSDPDFANPETAAKTQARLSRAAEAYGYTAEELGGINDARAIKVLNDAAKYRQLQASKAKAKKSPEAPRTVKPKARRPEPPQLARGKLIAKAKQSQSPDDWTAAFLE